MDRDPELTSSESEDIQSEYQEAMKDVEPFDQETAEKERKLEEVREKFIKMYAIQSIGGPEAIRKMVANRQPGDNTVKQCKDLFSDLVKSVEKNHGAAMKEAGRVASIVRAGMASRAGSEDGLKNTARVNVNVASLDDREMIFFQSGRKKVADILPEAVRETIERIEG